MAGLRAFLALLALGCAAAAQPRPIPVIFDTDIGDDIDDALALALALQSPELEVELVTTVIDRAWDRTRLAHKELNLYGAAGRTAVATGADEPLLDPVRPMRARQFEVLSAGDTAPDSARAPAAARIVDLLMRAPESRKFTVIPVGPLTNIALALRMEPRIRDRIERIVLMGGAFTMLVPEYNIARDRVAAEIVFRSGVPVVAVGLDVTTRCKLEGRDLDRLRAADNPASKFLVRLIDLWQDGHPNQFPTLHDPLAVAAAIRPALIETQAGAVSVETASPLTYGITIFSPRDRLAGRPATAQVARTVNVRAFLDFFIERLAAPPRPR